MTDGNIQTDVTRYRLQDALQANAKAIGHLAERELRLRMRLRSMPTDEPATPWEAEERHRSRQDVTEALTLTSELIRWLRAVRSEQSDLVNNLETASSVTLIHSRWRLRDLYWRVNLLTAELERREGNGNE